MLLMINTDSFAGLLNNAALMLILCVVYDTFSVYDIHRRIIRHLVTGTLVGFTCIVVMLTPWSLKPGLFFDTRWVLLSLSGLFFGLVPTAVAVIIAGVFRLYQGGPGGIVGTVVILSSACVGLAWRLWLKKSDRPLNCGQLYIFGVLVQLTTLACMFLFPAEVRNPIIKAIAPPILVIYPILTVVIGLILKRQGARRETERELADSRKNLASEKERLSVTLRSIADGVVTTDTTGRIVLLNTSAEQISGWGKDEAFGKPLQEVFDAVDPRTGQKCDPASQAMDSGRTVAQPVAIILKAKDGRELNITYNSAPIYDSQNEIVGAVLVFRDVSEQLRTEKELLKIKKLESVGILAGGIAHDFNNILAAILGNIELALLDKGISEETQESLSEAEKASIRARDLTHQLLTFSKGGDPVRKTSSLEVIIKESASFVLHGDKVSCRFEIPHDLWLVEIDPGQIGQVIQNLVINARDAMPEGGVVDISCENVLLGMDSISQDEEGKYVKICIQDSGTGIEENILEKIFDPYFSTKEQGSGLGLAIAQSIIRKHNGTLMVESSAGSGTAFTIYLPASEQSTASPAIATPEETKSNKTYKILVMDDDKMVRSVVQSMLSKVGHEVIIAADGVEAIDCFRQAKEAGKAFDLVIMDLTIPGGMGGKEAAREILKLQSDAKIIVSSGYSNDPIMANFQDYGFCSALIKPVQYRELTAMVSKVLG